MLNIQTEKQYREIVEKYSDMIYRIAYQRVLNQYDAEDIVQEVFAKLLCNKNYFRDGEHVKAWLIRVTVNLCVNYKKKLARQKTISASQLEIPFTEPEREILEELYLLSDEDRIILYYEEYKIREIAKILRQKQNTINSKLTRARNKLKKIMEVNNE